MCTYIFLGHLMVFNNIFIPSDKNMETLMKDVVKLLNK